MKDILKYMLGTILGLFGLALFGFILLLGISAIAGSGSKIEIEPNSVLYLSFEKGIVDRANKPGLVDIDFDGSKKNKPISVSTALDVLDYAKTDNNIKGIYMDLNTFEGSWANIEEVRNALIDFKSSGKFIMAYSNIYSNKNYYMASVANNIYMVPNGGLVWNGLSRTIMFFKGSLEKLGIEPQIFKVGKYKSAVEPYILDKMSDANREQNNSFMNSFYDHMLEKVSNERDLDISALKDIADEFKIRDDKGSVKHKLVDELLYKDEVLQKIREALGIDEGDEISSICFSDYEKYYRSKKELEFNLDKIAVVYAAGNIVDGKGSKDEIGGASLSKVIRKVREDENTKAMVLRVNSPGGSALASEIIWREVALTKKKMPVIVSMGNVAASGGYYISCLADTIVAQPNTITGSIGVFGIVPNLKGLYEDKLGLSFDMVKTSKYGDFGSLYRAFDSNESNIIQESVNRIYDVFLGRVSDGRGQSKEDIHKVAEGRVWTGLQAKENGLVDVIGGLEDAINIAKEKAKLEEYSISNYPKSEKKPWELILEALNESASETFIEKELGDYSLLFKEVKAISKSRGIQARLPYTIRIE